MKEQRSKNPVLTSASDPLDEVREYLAACAGSVSHAAGLTRVVATRLAASSAAKTSQAARTVAGASRATARLARVAARRLALVHREALILLICACLLLQPNAALATRGENNLTPKPANSSPVNNPPLDSSASDPSKTSTATATGETQPTVQSYFESLGELITATAAEPLPPPPVDAAVSRKVPSLSNGRVGGNLRVYAGQSFSFEGGFTVTDETYVTGTPNVTVATNATYHGSVDDGGDSQPTGYTVAVNGTSRLVGKLHIRANALAFPADIPASVPAPTGTRIVNINTASDVNNIGNWATLKELHVNKSGETIIVPPGTYGAFSVEGNSQLKFAAGVYNFSDGFTFASNASIKVTGQTTINVGSSANISNTGLLLGDNTLAGDVKLNVLGALCVMTGNSSIKALVRVPNGVAQVTGASVVHGQVIADTLQILTNGNVDGDTASSGPAETTPPVVAITSPTNNFPTTATTITVSGTASDPGTNPSGIAQVTVNNVAANYNSGNGSWTLANVPLAVGANTITARATDYAGNQSTPQTITVNRPDTTAPTVTISSPQNNFSTPNSSINLSGNAVDAGANQSGVAQVTINGQPASSFNALTGNWTFNNFPLNVGSNPIAVQAKDHANNPSTTVTINVIRQPPADNTAPTLSISLPLDGSHTDAATITVTGNVADSGQYPSGVAHVTVNGLEATINGDCTWTRANVPLNAFGPNSIIVIATDNAGNATPPLTRTVHRDNLADLQAPTITITSPANNFTSSEATITVSGSAVDSGANATGVRRVVVNGNEASYDQTTHNWTISGVTLNEGSNQITAFAEDGATPPNRSSNAVINVALHTPDTKAPTVTITSPLTALETYATTINLAGTAVDDGLNFTGVQTVTVNGTPATYNAGSGQWSLTFFPLAYGVNHIVVVARDGATPPNQAPAEVQVTRLQIPPPTLTVNSPQNGAVIAAASITVAGSVSTLGANPVTVTVNGENAPVAGGQFAKTVTLTEGANTITVVATDALSPPTQSSLSVIRDLAPPAVSFANVPATVQPGSSYQVLVDAVDNVGVADVEFRVNGQYVASATAAPYQFTLAVPLTYAPGATITLSAVARDLTNTAAVATAQTRTGGPGGISGYTFDDATGYVLPAVNVLLNGEAPAATDTLGVFNLVSTTPNGVVRLTKDGYTPVDRLYSVSQGEGTSLFDARLTPLDSHANTIGLSGGTATGDGGRVQLNFNPGTLGEQTDVRITSVSPQGLTNLLPYGWSPVPGAVIDVRSATAGALAFQAPAHLAISQVAGLTSAIPLVLARYDDAAHRWTVVAVDLAAANESGALSADLSTAGQYAFLVADTGATAPPPAVPGQPLTAAQPADSAALDSAQATAVATPRSAVFSASARSSISFLATASAKLPSGVSIEATFGETYNLLGGRDSELVDRPAQDFVLYAFPAATSDQPNRLGAFFVAKPTRTDFSITEIFNANVHVEIRSGRQSRLGVLIDASGGALRASDGSQLTIPANSVSGAQTVFFNNLSPQLANVSLPQGYEIIAAYDLEIGSATLTNSATISVPGLTGDLSRIVVARVLTVGGQRSPKAVARAVADSGGNLISTTTAPAVPAGVALAGINTSGRYLFIRVPQAFGYVKGVVTDSTSGGALGMVKVSGNQTPFIDVTGADGQFVVIGGAGTEAAVTNQIGAAALTTDATGQATASLVAQDAVANANIALNTVPLQVDSITPANGAQNMIATTPVTLTFNKPIAASSITGSSLTLSTSTGNPVLGSIAVLAGNRVAVFTPAATLAASTVYRVSLSRSVRDLYAHQLAADFTSTFTTAATVTINNRLRPEQISISYPDASGMSTISIPAGSVPEGSLILIVNTTSGSTLSTMAGTGALSLQIQARVGDELSLTITQPDGTQYRVTQAAYRRADGFVSVGANGGTITSDDGKILLSVPAGAVSGQADLKLTTTTEADIAIPRTGEMDPANVSFGAGVRITASGNFTNNQELHLELAAPTGVTEGQRVAFMKPGKITDETGEHDAWEVVTSGKVEDGKFKTMSPPFAGLTFGGIVGTIFFDYDVFIPRTFRAVVGKVTELVPNHAPRPIRALVKITRPGGAGTPVYCISAENGRFGTLDFAVSSGSTAEVEAKDFLNRLKSAVATPYLSTDPTETGLNGLQTLYATVQFPSSQGLPETLPALLRVEGRIYDLEPGQPDTLQTLGRVLLGKRIQIETTSTPDVQQISGQLLIGGNNAQQLVWTRQNAEAGTGIFTTEFDVSTEGTYNVVVTTFTQRDVITTRATATFGFVASQNPNIRPSLDGPPRVVKVTPADHAQQVGTGTRIHLEFNEPVKNLVPGVTVFLTNITTGQRIGGEITSGGLPITPTTPNISSIDYQPTTGLEAAKEYAVEVTSAVVDSNDHALDQLYVSATDNDPQPYRSTFSTFQPLVLTETPPTTNSYRLATAGDLAITVAPTVTGSTLNVFDISDPQRPVSTGPGKFVPFFATAYDIAEADQESDIIRVSSPVVRNYEVIAVVLSYSVQDSERPVNLWIYSLDNPATPELIGVTSLHIPRSAPSYPMYVEIHHKRAYVGNSGRDSLEVVDLEEAVHVLAESNNPQTAWFPAVFNGFNAGFNQDSKKQVASYRTTPTEAAPVYSLSVMDQAVPQTSGPTLQSPVVYVASNKLQLISFDTHDSWDGRTSLVDSKPPANLDDRVIGTKNLEPAGLAVDVRTAPGVTVGGHSTDIALLLGADRMWLFDVSNPRDPQAYPSRSFAEMGLGGGAARRMDVDGTLAYVMFADKVVVIDFSNPAQPYVTAVITGIGTDLRWLSVEDGFVYTLDMTAANGGVITTRLRSSIGSAAAVVYVHGQDGSACTNPVLISRVNDHMTQPAETIFKVYGHDAPQTAQVIIRKDTGNGNPEVLAELTPTIDPSSVVGVVTGRATWPVIDAPIDAAALYTAELVIDANQPTEFRAKRVPIVFSHLIDQFQDEFGVTKEDGGKFAYILGANAQVTLTVSSNNANNPVELEAAPLRAYGLHVENITLEKLHNLPAGRYQFKLTATLQGNPAVSEEAVGVVSVENEDREQRPPGSTVVGGVEIESGNLGVTHTDVTEINNRGLSLSFTRYYNSSGSDGYNSLGYGWAHNYQVLLTHRPGPPGSSDSLYLVRNSDGGSPRFKASALANASNGPNSMDPYRDTLRKNSDNSFDYFTKANIKYHFNQAVEAGSEQLFNQGYMGNLSYIEEPNGNKLTLAYDTQGRLQSVTDSSNRQLTFTYEQGATPFVGSLDTGATNNIGLNCTNRRFLRSLRRRFALAQLGLAWRISKITAPGGLIFNYVYDPKGNLERVERAGSDEISQPLQPAVEVGSLWKYGYDPLNGTNASTEHLLKSVQSPNHVAVGNHITSYEYEATVGGWMVSAIRQPESVSNTYHYTYTAGAVSATDVTDGRGNSTHYSFTVSTDSDQSRPQKTVTITAPRSATSTIVFDGYGNKLSETDPEGRQVSTHYDSKGFPDSQTITGGGKTVTTSAIYDPTFGKPLNTIDARHNLTIYSLDGHGNVTRIQLPNGREVVMDYAANGDLMRTVDQYGFATTYQYDAFGNPTVISRQTGGQATVVTHHSYDLRSRLVASDDTIGATIESTYDVLDHVVSETVTDPANVREPLTTTVAYLPEGQPTSITQAGGSQTRQIVNTYDGLNRLVTSVETPNGAGPFTLTTTYDRNSNVLTETDRRGVTTTRTYDELNFQLTETISGPFGATVPTYTATQIDLVGNPVVVLNRYNKETTFEYDGLHRLIRRHVPGGYIEETGYDDNGNITLQKDRNQRPTAFTYDELNRRTSITDAAGHVATWTYDDARRATTVQKDPQGLKETLQADGLGRPVRREVAFGGTTYVTTTAYDGRSVTVTDPRGIVSVKTLSAFGETGSLTVNGATPAYLVQMKYGPFGGLKRSVDANGREMTYALDGLDRATQIHHAGSGNFDESFTYDGAGNILSHTDLRHATSQMTYDNLGRRLTTVVQDDTAIPVETVAYDDAASRETTTDALGHATVMDYDGLQRLTRVTNAETKSRTLTYDGMNLRQETDYKGKVTAYVYDPLDRVTQITDRLGQVTNIVNGDSGGYTRTITDRRGNVRHEVYDPLQRLLSVNDGGQPLVSYEYDGNNNRTAMLDGFQHRTGYEYDKLNRVTKVDHPNGSQIERFTYDAVGNVVMHNDGAGGDVTQTYDELDHLKTRADSLGNTTRFNYDGGGLLQEQIDPKGDDYRTRYLYNKLGSLKRVTDAKGGFWEFSYDGAQNLKSIKDALQRTVAYDYDTLNRLQTVTQPQSHVTTYGYDANSNRTTVTDPKGQQTTIGYDALDRATNVAYTQVAGRGPRSYGYSYDPEGNLTSVNEITRLDGVTPIERNYSRSYDRRNRLTAATDPNSRTVSFAYDEANNLQSITDADHKETRYFYDAHNRLESVKLPGQTETVNYTWAADGLLKRVAYPSGMKREYDYDSADRLTSINNHVSATESDEFLYSYDANSNRATETRKQNGRTIRDVTYAYDLLDRLTAANYTAPGQRPANPPNGQSVSYADTTHLSGFDYDEVGNRKTSTAQDRTTTITLTTDDNGLTSESRQTVDSTLVTTTAQFDDLNRLTQLSSNASGSLPTVYSYDRNGNLTSTKQNGQVVNSYEYDGRDQLRRVLNAADQEVVGYDYDVERQRLSKTIGSASLNYVYAGEQVVNEFGANDQLANRYDLGAGGDVLHAEFGGEGERYFFGDGQGSVTSLAQLSGSSGSLTSRYEYDAWGNSMGTAGASYNSIGYIGQRFDAETGLMPLGNGERYYSPGLGSFIQQDSFAGMAAMAQSMNRYAYAHNNPLRFGDRNGNDPDPVEQWFRDSRKTLDSWETDQELANFALHYYLGMAQASYGFLKGVFHVAAEIANVAGDAVTFQTAALMGIEFEHMKFSSNLAQGVQKDLLDGDPGKAVKDLAWGATIVGPVIENVTGTLLDYNEGRITLDDVNERLGDQGGQLLGALVLETAAKGTAKTEVISESASELSNKTIRATANEVKSVGAATDAIEGTLRKGVGEAESGATRAGSNTLERLKNEAASAPESGYIGPERQLGTGNRGLVFVDEATSASKRALDYQAKAQGARSNLATRKGSAPALRYDNPFSRGKNLVRFDGLDGTTLIDRKLSFYGSKKAQLALKRQSAAISQNPGFSLRIEVPTAAAQTRGRVILQKLNIQNIDIKVVPE